MGVINKTEQADIGLILEGTYPYIRGGVSSWIHQIIQGLPEYTFAINFIGENPEAYSKMHYELPDNVVDLKCIYLLSNPQVDKPAARKGNKKAFKQVRRMYKQFRRNRNHDNGKALGEVLKHIHLLKDLDVNDFLYSDEAWSFMTERYEKSAPESSFLDYFWTIRAMHMPVFSLVEGLNDAVDAKVYHTISTGYAGLYGVMLHHLSGKKLIVTEHGIYTKERKIDLSQVDWIADAEQTFGNALSSEFSYIRKLWIRFFETLGRSVYSAADPIISISEGNKARQIIDGANPDKVKVIGNGINLETFQPLRKLLPDNPPQVIGFIGRVVPIKDVKTFIRAMSNVCSELENTEAWIIGGEEENPEYATECREMITSLHLEKHIIYKGFLDVKEILPQLGCVVLSSISEGVPLVILEAFASGIPVVSTDVGACRELIEGGSEDDKALGKAGAVVQIANSDQLASEIVKLISNPAYWKQLSTVAQQRADYIFGEQALFDSYREIYSNALEQG